MLMSMAAGDTLNVICQSRLRCAETLERLFVGTSDKHTENTKYIVQEHASKIAEVGFGASFASTMHHLHTSVQRADAIKSTMKRNYIL